MMQVFIAVADRLPLLFLFAGGYVVYRMLAVNGLTDNFVRAALIRSGGRPAFLILYVIGAAAILSAFIPNAVTVLTMLPMLKILDDDFRAAGITCMTTPLMASAVYGAGIGGMGTMIGTPANAVLLVALDLLDVPGRASVTFLNWFVWSLPLVVAFVILAWGVAAGLGLPAEVRGKRLVLSCVAPAGLNRRQRYGFWLFLCYLCYWTLDAVLQNLVVGFNAVSPVLGAIFTALFLVLVFVRHVVDRDGEPRPLLRVSDLARGIPRRGVLFMIFLPVVFGLARWSGLDTAASQWAGHLLEMGLSEWLFLFLAVLSAMMLTEVLSNTVVVTGVFAIVHLVAQTKGYDVLTAMVAVSVASTCAFMTPLATPANALAFGEMRGASLKRMLLLGGVLNVTGAVLVSGWLGWILPLLYLP